MRTRETLLQHYTQYDVWNVSILLTVMLTVHFSLFISRLLIIYLTWERDWPPTQKCLIPVLFYCLVLQYNLSDSKAWPLVMRWWLVLFPYVAGWPHTAVAALCFTQWKLDPFLSGCVYTGSPILIFFFPLIGLLTNHIRYFHIRSFLISEREKKDQNRCCLSKCSLCVYIDWFGIRLA